MNLFEITAKAASSTSGIFQPPSRLALMVFCMVFSITAVAGASTIQPRTITFDQNGYVHGSVIDWAGLPGEGTQLRVNNRQQNFNYAVTFDSEATGTADPNLEAPWSGGNIQGETLDLMLIIQGDDAGCQTGVCTTPLAEAAEPAGNMTFFLDTPASSFGLDLIDIREGDNGYIRFYPEDNWGNFVTINFDELLAGLSLGANFANRIEPITAESLGLSQFSRVGLKFYESAAVDNLTYVPVPEPATAFLLGGGLVLLTLSRKKVGKSEPSH